MSEKRGGRCLGGGAMMREDRRGRRLLLKRLCWRFGIM